MELLLVVPIVVIPLTVMADGRWSVGGVALWLVSVGFVVLWFTAGWRAFDRADAGLEPGSILAGSEWLGAACVAAASSVVWTRRRTRDG